ncbi:MAG: hypothetical protein WBK91_04095 [Alphaproteobacteria bacterium]
MTAFAAMTESLFGDPNLAVDAVYKSGTAAPFDLKVLRTYGESHQSMLSGGILSEVLLLRAKIASVPTPLKGDLIAVGITSSDPALAAPNFWTTNPAVRVLRQSTRTRSGYEWEFDTDPVVA